MPAQTSDRKEDNRFQPFRSRHLTSETNVERQETLSDGTELVTFSTGEQVLRKGQRKCIPCLISKKGPVLA